MNSQKKIKQRSEVAIDETLGFVDLFKTFMIGKNILNNYQVK